MKKLLLVLVLGGALLFPIVGWADTEGDASATLTLTAVINVNVDGVLTASIDQPGLDALATYTGTSILWLDFTGLITVEVVALTNFNVELTYTFLVNGAAGTLGNANEVLWLMDETGAVDFGYITNTGTALILPTGVSEYFLGTNNTPGETGKFTLKVNLDELGDRIAGDVVTFVINVHIDDPTV